jgi:hypothetical protein
MCKLCSCIDTSRVTNLDKSVIPENPEWNTFLLTQACHKAHASLATKQEGVDTA